MTDPAVFDRLMYRLRDNLPGVYELHVLSRLQLVEVIKELRENLEEVDQVLLELTIEEVVREEMGK